MAGADDRVVDASEKKGRKDYHEPDRTDVVAVSDLCSLLGHCLFVLTAGLPR